MVPAPQTHLLKKPRGRRWYLLSLSVKLEKAHGSYHLPVRPPALPQASEGFADGGCKLATFYRIHVRDFPRVTLDDFFFFVIPNNVLLKGIP